MVKTSSSSTSNVVAVSRNNINNEVKYKGVRKRKWGKYVSEIRLPNSRERIWLGSFDTAEKAARAFDAALFCLRGHNATFNFPKEPPNIAGGQSFTPALILAVAQEYANNSYIGGSSNEPRPNNDDASPSSNSDGGEERDLIDWSFLDMLDSNSVGNVGHVMDFGLFHEPEDMYMSHHFAYMDNEEDIYDHDYENGGNVQSFLWDF